MKKALILGMILAIVALGMVTITDTRVSYARSILLVDANNKYCPVTGEEIVRKKYNTGYSGKKYWFSSYDAVLKFKENPSKYIDKLGRNKASAKSAADTSTTKRKRFWRY